MRNSHRVSVVVPIYNVEQYLKECIDSLLNQTHANIEVILVNDGSPDASPALCDQYAAIDERVIVIHKENGGLSDARNAGLEVATGEYICFIDSDDYVDHQFIETLLSLALKHDADITEANYYILRADGAISINPKPFIKNRLTVSEGIATVRNQLTTMSHTETVTWNKLYKTKLFVDNKVRYPKGLLHEDTFTTYKLYFYSKKTIFISKPLYYYRQRKDSIMGRKFDERRLVLLEAVDEIREFAQQHQLAIDAELFTYAQTLRLGVVNAMVDSRSIDRAIYKNIRKKLLSESRAHQDYFGTRKHRLAMKALAIHPAVYVGVRRSFLLLQSRER